MNLRIETKNVWCRTAIIPLTDMTIQNICKVRKKCSAYSPPLLIFVNISAINRFLVNLTSKSHLKSGKKRTAIQQNFDCGAPIPIPQCKFLHRSAFFIVFQPPSRRLSPPFSAASPQQICPILSANEKIIVTLWAERRKALSTARIIGELTQFSELFSLTQRRTRNKFA